MHWKSNKPYFCKWHISMHISYIYHLSCTNTYRTIVICPSQILYMCQCMVQISFILYKYTQDNCLMFIPSIVYVLCKYMYRLIAMFFYLYKCIVKYCCHEHNDRVKYDNFTCSALLQAFVLLYKKHSYGWKSCIMIWILHK